MKRRSVLGGIAAMGGMGILAGCAQPAKVAAPFFSGDRQIGIQLYALGPDAGKDLAATLASVAAIGYRDIELPGLYGMEPEAIKAAADQAGVAISCMHVSPMAMPGVLSMNSSGEEIAAAIKGMGARKAVMPIPILPEDFDPSGPGGFRAALTKVLADEGADLWRRTADLVNTRAAELKPLGVSMGYHNHNIEFADVGGKTGWDILMDETDPDLVELELDLGWIASAGLDPVEYIRANAGRVTQLHVKDVAAGNTPNFALETKPTILGQGVLDWSVILSAAAESGVQHYYVEQEPPFTTTRIEAMKQSHEFLEKLTV